MKKNCYDSKTLIAEFKIFDEYLQNTEIVEILVNKENEIITETKGGFDYHKKNITKKTIRLITKIIAHENGLDIDQHHPTLSVDCPYLINGKIENIRISNIFEEYTENGICLSIRKKNPTVFPPVAFFKKNKPPKKSKKNKEFLEKQEKNLIENQLKNIFKNNKSVIISGGTSTGKTSCLNTIIKHFIPPKKRIITLEDTREIVCEHKNALQIINRDSTNLQKYIELLNITIRLRPDWLIIGEIRNKMASTFLNFASTGHPAITTIHAESPKGSIQRLADLIQLEGSTASKTEIENYISSCIKYIIQLKRGEKRAITSEIFEIKNKNEDQTTIEINKI